MRVLLVSHVAPPHIGGVENVVWMEAQAFLDAGHEVTWVTSDASGDGTPLPDRPGFELVRVPAWHLIERRFRIAYPLFSPSILTRLWREVGRADLIHVHGLVFLGSPLAALFSRMRRRRCICTDHGGLLRYKSRFATLALRLLMETAGRLTARCSEKLIAFNRDIEQLEVRLGGSAQKVQLLPNPTDFSTFAPPTAETRTAARETLGWTDGRPRVLCVSRMLPHKGIDILLEAATDEFELVFCGPGDPSCIQRIKDHPGARYLEPRPREQIVQLYHAADVFALPSYNEGFPIAIQEALACGLPVVTSDQPAYEPYRGTPNLHLSPLDPLEVRGHLRGVLSGEGPEPVTAPDAAKDRARWLHALCAPIPAAGTPS